MVFGEEISVSTSGYSDIKNITEQVEHIVEKSKVKRGTATVFAVGSTASITTIEFEPALNQDFREYLERIVPSSMQTRHSQTWGDDNGFSHIRATLMGPSITVPIDKGRMVLGAWQQIVVVDHDNRPRSRKIFVQVMGE